MLLACTIPRYTAHWHIADPSVHHHTKQTRTALWQLAHYRPQRASPHRHALRSGNWHIADPSVHHHTTQTRTALWQLAQCGSAKNGNAISNLMYKRGKCAVPRVWHVIYAASFFISKAVLLCSGWCIVPPGLRSPPPSVLLRTSRHPSSLRPPTCCPLAVLLPTPRPHCALIAPSFRPPAVLLPTCVRLPCSCRCLCAARVTCSHVLFLAKVAATEKLQEQEPDVVWQHWQRGGVWVGGHALVACCTMFMIDAQCGQHDSRHARLLGRRAPVVDQAVPEADMQCTGSQHRLDRVVHCKAPVDLSRNTTRFELVGHHRQQPHHVGVAKNNGTGK